MENLAITKIRAEYIAESMLKGMSFETALEKSFEQINAFLISLINNSDFNAIVFEKVKNKLDK
jgi:hypothetical protein